MTRSAAPSHMRVLHIYAAGDQCPEDNAGLQDHLQMPLVLLHAVYLVATFVTSLWQLSLRLNLHGSHFRHYSIPLA